jgi:hypothetical protein
MFAARWYHLSPSDSSTPRADWIDDSFTQPFVRERAEATLHAILRRGRSLYVSSLLAFQVPFFPQLMALLRDRFVLERVPMTSGVAVFRVHEASGAS